MKITSVRVRSVEVPDEDPIAGPVERQPATWPVVTLRIRTSDGLEGIGIGLAQAGLIRGLAATLEELADLLVGEDATRIEALIAKVNRHCWNLGGAGLSTVALSAIDCALWDIKAKAAGQPLWRMLGGFRDRVPTYASGPLHRGLTTDQVAGAAVRIVERGFRYVKMHLALPGESRPSREVERARVVREAVGPDVHLTCDINERWRVSEAIDMGRRLEEIGFYWMEDPSRADDPRGLARITAALSTPIMAGESCWGTAAFQQMLELRAVDILMIDMLHVGGITPWMKIAGMAEAFNVPVVSHIMPEFQAQIVAAVPNGLVAEYKTWTARLFDGSPELVEGDLVLSDRPGHGLEFSRAFRDQV